MVIQIPILIKAIGVVIAAGITAFGITTFTNPESTQLITNETIGNITSNELINHAIKFPIFALWDMIIDGIWEIGEWIATLFSILLQIGLGWMGINIIVPPLFGLGVLGILVIWFLITQTGRIATMLWTYGALILGILVATLFITYVLFMTGLIVI